MLPQFFAALLGTLLLASGCSAQPNFAPAPEATNDIAAFSSTRQINALTLDRPTLWAATAGGVLRRDDSGGWRKWTRADGLPSHEVRRVEISNGVARAITPRGVARLDGEKWITHSPKESAAPPLLWRGQRVSGTHELKIGESKTVRTVALPPSRGSHLSALLPQKNELWATLYGDGVWRFDGTRWTKANWNVPDAAREITALAGRENNVWLGTRRGGIWRYDGKNWSQFLQPNEPFDTNVQNMTAFGGALWSSSLEDGIARFDGTTWNHISTPELSSNAPRHLVPFANSLYARHGSGAVDVWDGKNWKRDVFSSLPRRKTFALAADKQKIYAAQWGGWSEFDGQNWTHFLRLPELQGIIIVSILPDGDDLWIGTQNRGIAQYKHSTQKLTWHDERAGLPDDWITALAKQGETVCAGTFVGGLAVGDIDGKWSDVPELRGQNVTALEPDANGGLWITTRNGLWHRDASGEMENSNARFASLDTELQALCATREGVWVGARTGIFWLKQK
jgi:ligand-binding sensor domain-containing protein